MPLRLVGLLLLVASLSGCWVIDELDAGSKKMDRYSPKSAHKVDEDEPISLPTGKRERVSEYFAKQKNARTLTKGQMPRDIVSCRVGGSTQFMKQTECASRGGVPRS